MNAKEFVDSLFEGYEETAALAEFKEELLGNLNAKIENFVKKGMDAESAFAKASAELGDVSALADDLSLKKRTEVFEEMYMDIRKYMPARRVAGYVAFGAVALFGITVALITLFAAKEIPEMLITELNWTIPYIFTARLDWTAFFASMMPFLTAAIVGFTFLGLTQETASIYPVSKKRGAWYAAAAGLISFGLFTMPIVYFSTSIAGDIIGEIVGYNLEALVPVISLVIPFILPGVGLLVYLILTEKDRLKPWAKKFYYKAAQNEREIEMTIMSVWSNPATAIRFGLSSGTLWIAAIGIFLLLGFLFGFKFSWLVFIFAIAIQLLLVQGFMFKRDKG